VKVIHVNETIGRVTVEPGIKIESLVELLKPHKMTLHNLTSFSGKTVGELTQMGCHGSGISLPPFDQAIRGMKIITASGEEIVLENGDERLKYAKCSLGTFGIVKELTLKCVPTYFLRETIRVLNYEEIFQGHAEWLHKFKHVKYHHIPTTGHAVVFTYEDLSYHQAMCANRRQSVPFVNGVLDKERRAKQQLLRLCHRHFGGNAIEIFDNFEEKHSSKTAAELKLWLLDVKCEDNEKFDHVKEINLAELDYWRCKKGSKIDVSDKILMKDIKEGQQGCRLSREFAFPIHYDLTDLEFIQDVLEIILRHRIPVTATIEQMWSSSSSAPLSPVYAADDATGQYHTWVSINFVSRELDENAKEIFDRYYSLIVNELGSKYDLSESLSTLQPVKGTESHFENLSNKIKKRIQGFEKERKSVDPEAWTTFYHMDEELAF